MIWVPVYVFVILARASTELASTDSNASDPSKLVDKSPSVVQVVNKPIEKPDTPAKKKHALKDMTAEEICEVRAKSVALIRAHKSSGTGFLVRPNILATNAHVIELSLEPGLKLYFPTAGEAGKKPLSAKLLYFDHKRDLAFLKISSKLEPLEINETYKFKGGQRVTVIGNPSVGELILRNAVSSGLMSSETELRGKDYYQLSISVNPGNSGGPVFDSKGLVIGIVTLKASQQEGIALCIPAQDILKGLAAMDKLTPEARAEMTSRHRVAAVFQMLVFGSKTYAAGIAACAAAMTAAMQRGVPPHLFIAGVKPQIEKKLKELDEMLEGLPEILKDLESQSLVPEEARRPMADLWNMCQEMKRTLSNPPGNAFFLNQTAQQYKARFQRLVQELSQTLGMEEPD
jgi:S1-C subfamily serine protease